MEILIGSQHEGVTVSVGDDQLPDSEGWVDSEVMVRAGAWSGRYGAQFLKDDFSLFVRGLAALEERFVRGLAALEEPPPSAVLASTDGYLDLTLTASSKLGHVAVSGEAWGTPRYGAHLELSFEIDQTYIKPILVSVEALLRQLSTPPRPD